ncbi:MAG: hypothetical protein A2293_07655 [Elusimicrobia bacterium RIFOXYB2_FULL_49_7]|nr:MAG: hypothetical protein A2293_07655 [Elusimicrobia bacterium RIFOXYB2_FULL_49_7]
MGGKVWAAQATAPSQTGVFLFAECLPQVNLDFDDLDPRDENNKPLQNVAAQNDLKDLFKSGLYQLLVKSELYTMAMALAALQTRLNLAACGFARELPLVAKHIIAVVLLSPRQWDKVLECLSGILIFASLVIACHLVAINCKISFLLTAPVVLRC